MKIGIDLGGSHIAAGLIQDGKILYKKERDFAEEDKNNIETVIENTITNSINEILDSAKISLKEIDAVRYCSPTVLIKEILLLGLTI